MDMKNGPALVIYRTAKTTTIYKGKLAGGPRTTIWDQLFVMMSISREFNVCLRKAL